MNTTIENRYIWIGGKIVNLSDAMINVLSPTAQFGANVFEGIRCYWNDEKEQLYAFRLKEHYKRLLQSVKIFKMNCSYSSDEFEQYMKDVVRANDYREDIAVRQTVFIDGFGTWSSKSNVNMFIAPIPKKRSEFEINKGLSCKISSWQRISDRNISPRAKVGANYINSRMAQLEAMDAGYDSAIFLNENGKVAEGPGSCLFMIREGKFITPPVTASVLDSITRKTIIDVVKNEMGMEVIERDIDRTELYICEEAFLCGSAMEIKQITSIDGYSIDGEFKYTRELHKQYIDIVSGKNEQYIEWLTEIY